MTDEKNIRSAKERTYSYHMIGKTNPVRVTHDGEGRPMDAEAPDPKTGELKRNISLVSIIFLKGDDSLEITKTVFEARHNQILAEKKSDRPIEQPTQAPPRAHRHG